MNLFKRTLTQGRWLPIFSVSVLVLIYLRSFLPPDTLPSRGDPTLPFQGSDLTPQFAVWARLAIHALKDQGVLPLWNPYTHSGAPLFEIPQAGSISLSSLLGFLFSPEAAIKWSMLLHVGLGVLGVYAFALLILRLTPFSSAIGGLAFGFGTFLLDHFRVGHLNQVYPMTLIPWTLLTFWKSIRAKESGYRWAILSGVTVGIQVLEGADNVLFYEALVLIFVMSTLCLESRKEKFKKFIRIALMGAITGATSFILSAFQLLPMLSYLPNTGRTGCLPWEFASQKIQEVGHPYPGPISAILLGLGSYYLWKKEKPIAVWLLSSLLLGIVTATYLPIFHLFWSYLPGFCYQRIPGRALVLYGIIGPLIIAAGVHKASELLNRHFKKLRVLPYCLVGMISLEFFLLAPPMPPMMKVQNEIESNHAMKWLSDHTGSHRIHVWESHNRHWGTEHVTVPLGLEVVSGYTSSENQDYFPFDFLPEDHRTFFGDSYRQPAKFWGLLNVKYVLSTQERNETGFHLAAKTSLCPIEICQPQKSSGPWIYENEKVLPKSYGVPKAIAIVGDSRSSFETVMEILLLPQFNPKEFVLIQAQTREALPPVDLILSAKGSPISGISSWSSAEGQRQLQELLIHSNSDLALGEDSFIRPNVNQIDILPSQPGWHVVSERIGLFPGWSAQTSDAPVSIYRANGVLGAFFVPSKSKVSLNYEPKNLRMGFWILLSGILVWAVAEIVVILKPIRKSVLQ